MWRSLDIGMKPNVRQSCKINSAEMLEGGRISRQCYFFLIFGGVSINKVGILCKNVSDKYEKEGVI